MNTHHSEYSTAEHQAREPENRLLLNGEPVSHDEAREHWLASETYQNAHPNTRHSIWRTAMRGSNQDGVIIHINEAGITFDYARNIGV